MKESSKSRKQQFYQQIPIQDTATFRGKYLNRVREQLSYASLGRRLLAFMIDFVCSSIFISILPMLITSIITQEKSFTTENLMKLSIPLQISCCIIAIAAAVYYFCFYPSAASHNGQTIGKRIMRIKVQKQNGKQLQLTDLLKRELLGSLLLEGETAFPSAFVRYIAFLWMPAMMSKSLMILSIIISLCSILWCIIDKRRCMFHDLIANTSVVDM